MVVDSKAFVAAYFTDNLAVIDLEPEQGDGKPSDLVGMIALGPEPKPSVQRRGERDRRARFRGGTGRHASWAVRNGAAIFRNQLGTGSAMPPYR